MKRSAANRFSILAAARALPPAQKKVVAALLAVLAVAQIGQPFPETAWLHHLPTALLLIAAPLMLRRWPLSDHAVGCVTLFLILHTIGGRYTYTEVPYDDVARMFAGMTVTDFFGFSRNHYDRLVHLSYGFLAVFPVQEALRRHLGLSRKTAIYIAVESVLAMSALYEIFEWLLTLTMAGAVSNAYNGQQGDIWDAQKDMALAALGAFLALMIITRRRVRA